MEILEHKDGAGKGMCICYFLIPLFFNDIEFGFDGHVGLLLPPAALFNLSFVLSEKQYNESEYICC